jgi:hypothetical protein
MSGHIGSHQHSRKPWCDTEEEPEIPPVMETCETKNIY